MAIIKEINQLNAYGALTGYVMKYWIITSLTYDKFTNKSRIIASGYKDKYTRETNIYSFVDPPFCKDYCGKLDLSEAYSNLMNEAFFDGAVSDVEPQ